MKFITNYLKKLIADSVKHELAGTYPTSSDESLNDIYLFDFYKGYNQNTFTIPQMGSNIGSITGDNSDSDSEKKSTQKIRIKPIDVLNELETKPIPFTLELLDEKISVLKDKSDIIRQTYAKREVDALIERLEHRKLYQEHHRYFEKFQNTDDGKVAKLLDKYDLVMNESDIFIPEFPDEAIQIMKEYEGQVRFITKKKLVFYVIAEPDKFRDAYDKRDPILLVQSPFGFYYQILGAWDKEMLLLSEL